MDPAIAKELAALREEIEALRAATQGGRAPAAGASPVEELIAAMQGAVETTGASVAGHPIAGVAAAFVAGLLIGRLTKIG